MICKMFFRHCRGVENIQDGIGLQSCLLIKDVSIFVGGMALAFYIHWKLTLALMTVLPVSVTLGAIHIWVRML